MKSYVMISTALQGRARIYLADTTDIVETSRLTHDLWPSSCTAFGRSLSITSVMASMLKNDDEAITTIINGNGPIGTIMCVATGDGRTGRAPVDVWIKKVIDEQYGGVNPFEIYGDYAGIVQQFLFYYRRNE